MNDLIFEFKDIKPININNSYFLSSIGGKARRIKKKETSAYEDLLNSVIFSELEQVERFNKTYDPLKHYLVADYIFHMPLFTKKKEKIHARKGDWDAFPKILQDCIFKHLENADDSAIINANVTQVHAEKYHIYARISIRSLDCIR